MGKRSVATEARRRTLRRELDAWARELRAPKRRSRKPRLGARTVSIWTWDRGPRPVDMDGAAEHLVPILETVLQGGLWSEFRKFPIDTIERLLPILRVSQNTRDLLEMWIEEAPVRRQT